MEKPVKNLIHNWYMNPETRQIHGRYEDIGLRFTELKYIRTSPVEQFLYTPSWKRDDATGWVLSFDSTSNWRVETRNSIYCLGLPLVLA
jgi:hypothetical protein